MLLFFFLFFFFVGEGGDYFPQSSFIKAIISIHMYIVQSSICHPSKYQTSKFFFLDFQNGHPGSVDFQNLKVSGSPGYVLCLCHSEAAISSKLKSEPVLMFEALYCSKYMEFRNILYHNRKMKDDISCMYKIAGIKPL